MGIMGRQGLSGTGRNGKTRNRGKGENSVGFAMRLAKCLFSKGTMPIREFSFDGSVAGAREDKFPVLLAVMALKSQSQPLKSTRNYGKVKGMTGYGRMD